MLQLEPELVHRNLFEVLNITRSEESFRREAALLPESELHLHQGQLLLTLKFLLASLLSPHELSGGILGQLPPGSPSPEGCLNLDDTLFNPSDLLEVETRASERRSLKLLEGVELLAQVHDCPFQVLPHELVVVFSVL